MPKLKPRCPGCNGIVGPLSYYCAHCGAQLRAPPENKGKAARLQDSPLIAARRVMRGHWGLTEREANALLRTGWTDLWKIFRATPQELVTKTSKGSGIGLKLAEAIKKKIGNKKPPK